jgi:hypothetical protein
MTKLTAAKIKKTTNRTYAICVAVPAIPDNPSNPAIIATTKNVTAQLSIADSFRQERWKRTAQRSLMASPISQISNLGAAR